METDDTNGVLEVGGAPPPAPPQPVGIYGWRKRCLYAFVLILMVIIIMNAALTVWILRALKFSIDGMDTLKISSKGVRIDKDVEFLQAVYTNKVQSKKSQSLYLMSHKDVRLLSTTDNRTTNSKLVVGEQGIEATCDSFKVQGNDGIVRMQLDGNEMYLGTKDASYPGSLEITDSVSTPSLRSPEKKPLEIESKFGEVLVTGLAGVSIRSDSGDVTVETQENMVFESPNDGMIRIESASVYFPNLPKSSKPSSSTLPSSPLSSSSSSSSSDIYQLCACGNGKLFLATAKSDCRKRANDICNN